MKKVLCLCLVFAMLTLLCGCGPTEKDKLLGSWTGVVDLTYLFNETMSAEAGEEVGPYLHIQEFPVTITLTFNEDDTFSMIVDEEALAVTVDNAKADLSESLKQYLMDTVSAALGVEMPIEELLEYAGISMDAIMDGIFTQELIDGMVSGVNSAGKFVAEEGKLYLSAGLSYEVDKSIYESYTLEGKVLTLLEFISGEEVDSFTKALYPMVFNKVS